MKCVLDPSPYIGIPFVDHGRTHEGCDCWGLVKLVLKEQLGLETPDFCEYYVNAYDRKVVNELLHCKTANAWNYDVTNEQRMPFDILVFGKGGIEIHVGLHVSDRTMIHVISGSETVLERYDTMKWKRRLERVVRPIV